MPEGPEVYTTTKDLSIVLKEQTFIDIEIVGGRYSNKYPDNWDALTNLLPLVISGVFCKGKMMWFEFENTPLVLVSRFGMSGYYGHRKDDEESPKHTAVEFTLMDNSVIYYNDVRRFGTFKILPDGIDSELKKLGPCFLDPLHPKVDKISDDDFVKLISKKKGFLVNVLMDQEIVSGIGNYILSECLYAAEIYPLSKCEDLTETDLYLLHLSIRNIMETSIEHKGVSLKDYRSVFQTGEGQNFLKVYGKTEDPYKNKVEVIKKGPHGRAIYWVKEFQTKL